MDSIKIVNGEVIYTTIDNKKPKGICGSGIVDLISELFLNNYIDFAGILLPDSSSSIIKFEDDMHLSMHIKKKALIMRV
ncbi:DUF4445 domain-containing protein [Romboutsia ilealis]|uniref:DUF4445 domain-containing protein n=1 Tax=Romboutsia faecis TaxID=2764597 RepID=A0ABR7JK07_9FIRM|nr:DUF4445 domain-containing protein [Romboutsia faecis]MRN24492.1 DUF4445 domain-containing protein [Romboutsia ilealis]